MANAMDGDVRGSGRKRAPKCERTFLDKEGNSHGRSFEAVHAVKFVFLETDHELVMGLDELPEGVLRAAAAFGINTSVGNTFGAISDPDDAIEAAEERWETLKSGRWSAERETGPRTSDLIEAVCRAREERGQPVADDFRDNLRAKFADPAYVKAVEGDPRIAVHVAAIRKERAEDRARKAQERAAAAGDAGGAADELLG